MGCGAYKASVGKPPAPGRPERGPGADAETHRGNAGGKPTISGQSRFSTPAAAHAGGPQIAQRGRIEVLEGVDGGKRQPHLARGDADLGAADDDDADGSGEDLEPAAGRGPEQRAGPHRSGRRARVPASPPDCPAGLERARGTGRRHRQRAQSVVTANPLGGIPIQSKQ